MKINLDYEQYFLPNGLKVILHEDHSAPLVAVNLWYHVGSKNETPGRTGFAHLFEHLMFEGSKHRDSEYFELLQEAGANVNGSTNADRTNYYESLPSNFLELALWLEADRMGYLLDVMTQEKLDNQRDVVKNEKRQRYDNVPYGLVGEKIARSIYPPDHGYNWLTIGSMEDLTAASLDDVKNFFRRFYVPNNASLVVAGDFEPDAAKRLIEKYFAPLARGAEIVRPDFPLPDLNAEIRAEMPDKVQLARIYAVWHTIAEYDADEAALDFLAAILSSGRGSLLQQNLVFTKQIAQDVSASHFTREIAGQFQITATVKPDQNAAAVEAEILAEIEKLKQTPPTDDEMERALNAREAGFIYALQTVLGKADQLNGYATMRGEPDFFAADLERYRAVKPADVQRVANQYLTEKRFVLTVKPNPEKTPVEATSKPKTNGEKHKKSVVDVEKLGGLYVPPKPQSAPSFVLPNIERHFLTNGLEVLIVKKDKLPIVSLNLIFKTGGTANPLEKFGLASLTASLLNQGTKNRTAIEISNELQKIGASLGAGAGWDASSIGMLTLTKNLRAATDIFSDVAVNPIFPAAEFELQRKRLLIALLQQRDNAAAIAANAFAALVYGKNHAYGNALVGDEKTIARIEQSDFFDFYAKFYRPNNAALIAVGDVGAETLLPRLEEIFADWKPAEVSSIELPDATHSEKSRIFIIDKPGAAQSIVQIGQIAVGRYSPDFFALQVMNSILGGQFTSRVNMNLREDKGYTYGARTGFDWRRGKAPFTASASVQTNVTKETVIEFLREIEGVRGAIPVTEKELEYNKQSIIRRFPAAFETAGQIAGQLASLVVYDLPDSYFDDFTRQINAVTIADVNRAANEHLNPAAMTIVVVGDKNAVEPRLREIKNLAVNSIEISDL